MITQHSAKPGMKHKAITEYKDESWIGKAKFALEGVVCLYDPANPEEEAWNKVKQVPSDRIVAEYEGAWRKQIRWRRKGEKEWKVLIDMDQLNLVPKDVRPLAEQEESESQRLWEPVTSNIMSKQWSEATREKQVIEQKQRTKAGELKRTGQS